MAESFGVDVDRYDRTRQPYPDALIERIVTTAPGPAILDVGCGTGIAARQFQAAGRTVLGVEPDARMADFARDRGLDVEVATFEDWDPAGREFDAVVAATAWHWVDPVAGAVTAARVLRPLGLFAAFWHVPEPPAEVARALVTALHQVMPDVPFPTPPDGSSPLDTYYGPLLTNAANGIREAGGFAEPEQWRFEWERTYTRAEWLDQLPTSGILTRLPEDALAVVLDTVGAAIDAIGGSFRTPYLTVAMTAIRAKDPH